MRNGLQYAYSISVFVGVLVTAYLMLNRELNANIPTRAADLSSMQAEEASVDPALGRLFEMEAELARLRQDRLEQIKRIPTDKKSQ